MSDNEYVSAEVRELLELVLQEPDEREINATSTNDQQPQAHQASLPDTPIQSTDVLTAIIPNPNINIQQKVVPIVAQSADTVAPEPDLRLIESNALKLIAQYGTDTDSSESDYDTDSSDEVVAVDDVEVILDKTITDGNYRVVSSDSEESTSSDDSDCEVISIQNEIINLDEDDVEESDPKSKGPIRVEGEFTIDSLPPIEDLKISVPEDECVVLGKIMSVVDQLVVVESLPGSRAIDIDSVLFLEKGTKPLGHVFDVLGNISSPMYCVRFNSNKQIQEKGISVGALVYVAPRTEHTSFVIVSELMKQKGCDASWKNDIEPINAQDFSDDEEERNARKLRRGRNNNSNDNESVQSQTPTTNFNNQRNTQYRTPRRRGGRGRGGFNHYDGNNYRGGNNYDGNHFGSPSNSSWHHNLQPSNWNSPMRNNAPMRNTAPMGQFPASLLLPPPPPPPPFNSRR